jgi:hypothetical protein
MPRALVVSMHRPRLHLVSVALCMVVALTGCSDDTGGGDRGFDDDVGSQDTSAVDAPARDGAGDAAVEAGANHQPGRDAGDVPAADSRAPDGGDSASGPSNDWSDVSAEEFYARYLAVSTCGYLMWCDNFDMGTNRLYQEWCHPDALDEVLSDELPHAVGGARVDFDQQAAQRCLEALDEVSSCEELAAADRDDCEGVLSPRQGDGDDCIDHVECTQGLFCLKGDSCPGQCTPRRPDGGECSGNAHCQEGLFCSGDTGECADASRAKGEACDSHLECASGLTCCTSQDACSDAEQGTCVDRRGQGEACGRLSGSRAMQCERGLHCIDGTCGPGGDVGDSCHSNKPCEVGKRCHEGSCYDLVLPGEGCQTDGNCPHTYDCAEGICEPWPLAGESCEEAESCYTGVCNLIDMQCTWLPTQAECHPRQRPQCYSGYCKPDSEDEPFGSGTCARRANESLDTPCHVDFQCGNLQVCSNGTCSYACR